MDPLTVAPNLIDRVHLSLVDAIADGSLAPNERLTQEEIARKLSVSRQPVSHALQLLKRQGLVVEQGKRGLTVAPVEPHWIRGLYQVRAALDGLAARLSAERISDGTAEPHEIEALRARFAAGSALGNDASTHEWIEADVAFHSQVYALSGNPAISETVADRWPHFKRGMGIALVDLEWRKSIWVDHVTILDRILAGDSLGAVAAAVNHLEKAGARLFVAVTARAKSNEKAPR
jgi:DNA-binding GntR family transcriptional regulator